jgi:hypothetical protein
MPSHISCVLHTTVVVYSYCLIHYIITKERDSSEHKHISCTITYYYGQLVITPQREKIELETTDMK